MSDEFFNVRESSLYEIYRELADTPVDFMIGDKRTRVRGLDNLETAISKANCPIRVQLPVGANASGRSIIILDAEGTGRSGVWSVPEIALLAPAAAGQGLEEFAGPLIKYVVAFEHAIVRRRTVFAIPTEVRNAFVVSNISFDTGVYNWPVESTNWWFGCRTVLTVQELM